MNFTLPQWMSLIWAIVNRPSFSMSPQMMSNTASVAGKYSEARRKPRPANRGGTGSLSGTRNLEVNSPTSTAYTAARVRSEAPSFSVMLLTLLLIVFALKPIVWAISAFVRPWTISPRTSTSRGESSFRSTSAPCGGSGLADAVKSFSLTTDIPTNTETDNAETGSRAVSDGAGNSFTVGPVSGNKVDKKAPRITLKTPPDNASYNLGDNVAADYSCSDGGSDVDRYAGPAANGSNVHTGSVGQKSFAVEASDAAGNTATLGHTYAVNDNVAPTRP